MSTLPGNGSNYLLLFRNTDLEQRLSPDEIRDAMERFDAWLSTWTERGFIKGGQPLGPQGKVITPGKGVPGARQRVLADGPFAESKEVLGGYVMVQASSLEEATSVAEGWPLLDYDASVEVRPVLDMCPTLAEWRREHAATMAAV